MCPAEEGAGSSRRSTIGLYSRCVPVRHDVVRIGNPARALIHRHHRRTIGRAPDRVRIDRYDTDVGAELDSEAVARVVRRAIEIESAPDPDGLDPRAVVEAAVEVGIDPEAIREAIAWERLGERPPRSRLDRVAGSSIVIVDRVIRAPVADLLEQLDAWLTVGHHLRREVAERVPHTDVDAATIEWAKRDDLAASVQRSIRSMAGGAALGSVRRVSAHLVGIDDDRSIVRLEIDRHVARNVSLTASGGVGTASIAGGAVAVSAAAAPFALAAGPGLLIAGGTAIAARRRAVALARELRRLLDQIDAGDRPATIVGGVAQRIGLRRA